MQNNIEPENRLVGLFQRMSSIPMLAPPKGTPLSFPQAMILQWIAVHPGCGVLEIAHGLNVTPPTVSVGIRRLIKGDWLEQRLDPNDRRSRPIYLTEKGSGFVETMKNHRSRMLTLFLSGLTNEEQDQLINLLERAVSALESSQEDAE